MLINDDCRRCMLRRRLDAFPADAAPEDAAEYRRRVRALVEGRTGLSGPELSWEIDRVREALFGPLPDMGPVKRRFNDMLLALEPRLQAGIDAAADPLKRAIQYAMAGNFIDFAVMGSVDEAALQRIIERAADLTVDPAVLERLRARIMAGRRLLLMTDNCGEIVMDKALLSTIGRLNPELGLTAMVRGAPVTNDATLEDAAQVGLDRVARVIGSGCGVAGNPLVRLSDEARRAVDGADVLVSKGQANYETLSGCGLDMFYIFMCKCDLFVDRFRVPKLSGVLTWEAE